jgi:hypothetical protein
VVVTTTTTTDDRDSAPPSRLEAANRRARGAIAHRDATIDAAATATAAAAGDRPPKIPPPRTTSAVLPERLITVFGLESSGTTFLSEVLAGAVNAGKVRNHLEYRNDETSVVVQHLSLPWGRVNENQSAVPDVEFMAPYGCLVRGDNGSASAADVRWTISPACRGELGLATTASAAARGGHDYPPRFFVNAASHVRWYRSRGTDATAVLLVRDHTVHMQGKRGHALGELRRARDEDARGGAIMGEAMRELSSSSCSSSSTSSRELVMASYETLMSLKFPYLLYLYDQLGINSTYQPNFRDGNLKYVRRHGGWY